MRISALAAILALPAAIIAAATLTAPAFAAGPNGGVVTVAEGHPIELVSTGTDLTFFVTDEDAKPVQTAGMTAKAYVQAGGKTETVALKGAAPNRLVGTLPAALPAGAKVVLSAKMHGHSIQARFEK